MLRARARSRAKPRENSAKFDLVYSGTPKLRQLGEKEALLQLLRELVLPRSHTIGSSVLSSGPRTREEIEASP
jgi:hypothetical protein